MNIEQERTEFEAWYRLHHGYRMADAMLKARENQT